MSAMKLENTALARLFERMAEGVLIIDSGWNIVFANSLARAFLGIPTSAVRIREDLIPKLSRQFILSADLIDVAIDDEQSVAFEASNRPEHSFDMVLSLYMSRATEDGLRFLMIRDVTNERREELLKRSFLSLISHKLLTPITVIRSCLENISAKVMGPVTEKQQEALGKGLKKLDQLSGVVSRLFAYTQMQAEQPGLSAPVIDALAKAGEFCAEFDKRPGSGKAEFVIGAAEGDASVAAREKPFFAVLENIFENSVKFSQKERVRISISGRRDKEGGGFCLNVEDDGPGIPPGVLAHAFEEFTQRDDDFTGNTEGLGLGLPMVRNLMNLFGGRVEVESSPGRGTRVKLFFPAVE